MTETDPLLVKRDGAVAVVTLNRPERRNALNRGLLNALPAAMAELDADDAVGAIVLTGAGPAFCAGLDLTELGNTGANLGGGTSRPFPIGTTPVIGAVNGAAVTGGLELALWCDFLIAGRSARFADTHAQVGVMPGWGLTYLLPQAVGLRRARQMSVSGRFVDAETAFHWGLVNEVVADEDLLVTALDLASDIAALDRSGVARMLETYRAVAELTDGAAQRVEHQMGRDWLDQHFDRDDVAAVRSDIIARGRRQVQP